MHWYFCVISSNHLFLLHFWSITSISHEQPVSSKLWREYTNLLFTARLPKFLSWSVGCGQFSKFLKLTEQFIVYYEYLSALSQLQTSLHYSRTGLSISFGTYLRLTCLHVGLPNSATSNFRILRYTFLTQLAVLYDPVSSPFYRF